VARKNGNGEGSRPRKRPDGRWEARYWEEGPSWRKKRRSVYGSSRKECADKLAEAMSTEKDFVLVPTNITLSEFLAEHLESTKETLKKRTWEGHEETARVHLVPMLGHLKLKELSRERVQSLYATKRAGGLSPGAVRRIHAVLSAALSRAVRWQLVPYNGCPTTSAKTRTRREPHPQIFAYSTPKKREPLWSLPRCRKGAASCALLLSADQWYEKG
jgi:integrase